MKYRDLPFILVLLSCLFTNGCATVLTISAPSVEEVTLGKKATGKQISINYHYFDGKEKGTLMKQPYCFETAEQMIMTRKRMHGAVPAIIEIPIFGLGLLDLISAGVYAKASEEEVRGNFVETGEIVECGKFAPAPETELIIQCAETGQINKVSTDTDGNISTNQIYAGFFQNAQLNLFVKEDGGFAYITTISNY